MGIQTKLIAFLGAIVVMFLACLGTYIYGQDVGQKLERGRWEQREAQRASNVATTAIAHTTTIIKEVEHDNEIERKANEALTTAQAELRTARADNRRLIAANGGLRISADACAGRDGLTGQTQATGTGSIIDATAGTIALPERIEQDLQRTADEADDYLEILRAVQQWAAEHGYIGPIKPKPE